MTTATSHTTPSSPWSTASGSLVPLPRTDRRSRGGSRGIVWAYLAAEMRAEARADGDDRFAKLDVRVPHRTAVLARTSPHEGAA